MVFGTLDDGQVLTSALRRLGDHPVFLPRQTLRLIQIAGAEINRRNSASSDEAGAAQFTFSFQFLFVFSSGWGFRTMPISVPEHADHAFRDDGDHDSGMIAMPLDVFHRAR